jgi:4,5-DOPA dioxygenase extradiol
MFLRKKGVFVISSGNIVHNLRQIIFKESAQYDWALEFDETSKNLIEKGDFKSLINYQNLGKSANLSIPTPDHYFPLMYALGLKTEKDQITFPVDGVTYGSTSMRSVLIA